MRPWLSTRPLSRWGKESWVTDGLKYYKVFRKYFKGHLLSVLQVCSVLESLEQEYKREEDWCGGADKLGPNCETDHVTPMISKHLEQKEAFLKVTDAPTISLDLHD